MEVETTLCCWVDMGWEAKKEETDVLLQVVDCTHHEAFTEMGRPVRSRLWGLLGDLEFGVSEPGP